MSAPTANSLAPHVEAAKRVLRELERHADAAIDTLNGGDSSQFAAAIQERETLLAKLSQVVDVLNHERARANGPESKGRETAETRALMGDLARAAASVMASHERLVASVTVERDRLAGAVSRADKPDKVANQYAAMSYASQQSTLSVTG